MSQNPAWGWLAPLIAMFLGGFSVAPLFRPGIPEAHDALHHLARLVEFDRVLGEGVLYPRWAPDYGLGHGFPIFNFIPPLPYYVMQIFYRIGLTPSASLEATLSLSLVLSALTMYLFAREVLSSRLAGVVAAVAYVYTPYHLADIYVRAALAEDLAYVFFPLVLWSLHRLIAKREVAQLAWGGLALAGLVTTHNVTALPFLPLAGAYALWLLLLRRQHQGLGRFLALTAGLFLIGLGLSAYYWLPALMELGSASVTAFAVPGFRPVDTLIPIADIVQGNSVHEYGRTAFRIGLMQALATLIGLGAYLAYRWRKRHLSVGILDLASVTFALMAIGVLLFIMSPNARLIWEAVPILDYIQFSWRLLAFIALGTALLAGGVSQAGRLSWPLALLLGASLAYSGMAGLEPTVLTFADEGLSPTAVSRREYGSAAEGKTMEDEFVPTWVKADLAARAHYGPAIPSDDLPPLEVSDLDEGQPLSWMLTVRADTPTALRFHTFYFPGWQARLDGHEVPTYPSTDMGLVTVDIPAGQHHLQMNFGDTPLRQGSLALSLMALLVVCLLPLRRRPAPRGGALWRYAPLAFLILFVSLLGLGGGTLARLGANDSSAEPMQAAAIQSPSDSGVRLLAWGATEVGSGKARRLRAVLFWQVLRPTGQDWHLVLRLKDHQGQTLAESGFTPVRGASPTSGWAKNELIRDERELRLPSDLVAGGYYLELSMSMFDDAVASLSLGEFTLSQSVPEQGDDPIIIAKGGNLGGQMMLESYWVEVLGKQGVDTRSFLLAEAAPGELIGVTLHWRALAWIGRNYTIFVHLLDRQGRMVAQKDNQPQAGWLPTSAWEPGEAVEDRYTIIVPSDAPPGPYTLEVGAYMPYKMRHLTLGDGKTTGFPLGAVFIRPSSPVTTRPQHKLQRNLEGGIQFIGYDLALKEVRPGGEVKLTLYWQAEEEIEGDFNVFTHLLDEEERIWGQHDAAPASGAYPTWAWRPGEIVRDEHNIPVNQEAPPGHYRLEVGLYDWRTGKRLVAEDGADRILLGELTVVSQ